MIQAPMTPRHTLPFALLLACLALAPAHAADPYAQADKPPEDPWTWEHPLPQNAVDGLSYALSAQGLTLNDLNFQKDPLDDAWRLPVITKSLHDPLSIYDTTWEYGKFFDNDDPLEKLDSADGFDWVHRQLDLSPPGQFRHYLRDEHYHSRAAFLADKLADLTRDLGLDHSQLWPTERSQESRTLMGGLSSLIVDDPNPTVAAPDGYPDYQTFALHEWDLLRLGRAGGLLSLMGSSIGVAHAASQVADLFDTRTVQDQSEFPILVDTLKGQGLPSHLIIGTVGDDTYHLVPGDIVIDPGGDDRYISDTTPTEPLALQQLIIDCGGNDVYEGSTIGSIAGGICGTSIVIDQSGDDVYRTGPVSQGAGLFGIGILIDKGGNDLHYATDFVEGAGMFGFGLAWDGGGNDYYSASEYGQAAALTGGLGVLIDRAGDDVYFAGGAHQDFPRWPEHTESLSQGCAIGLRPQASGGIAFLGDYAGNDHYSCEVFGQGVGYWYSLGMLLDRSGHDWYDCHQYGQGAGIHLAAGCLIDVQGIDHYNGWADLQGAGHDLGAGMFLDMSGRDFETCNDLSQGVGNANAVGIAIDLSGDDAWMARNADNCQGYGNPRRDFGSIGVLLDCAGKDEYSIPGHTDGGLWTFSTWGVGYDMEAPAELAPVKFYTVLGTTGAS